MSADPTLDKPLRADARRNRERLLDAALRAVRGGGTGRRARGGREGAGVGIGTLYRHFPTRDALVEAAYRNEVAHLCEAADELAARPRARRGARRVAWTASSTTRPPSAG